MSSPAVDLPPKGDADGVSLIRCPGVDVISVVGDFDVESGYPVRRLVGNAVEMRRHRVILDLSRTTFMDASAIGTMVYCSRVLAASSAVLSLVCPEGPALRILCVLGLDRAWTIHPTRDDALRSGVDRFLRVES